MVAVNKEEQVWNRKSHVRTSPASALLFIKVYRQEVIVAAVCRRIKPINPAKMRVLPRNLSMIKEPNTVKMRYVALRPKFIPNCSIVPVIPTVFRAGTRNCPIMPPPFHCWKIEYRTITKTRYCADLP